jgi:hypothetical protein
LVTAVDLHESGLAVSAYRFDFRLPGRLLPDAAAPKRSATSCADDGPDKDNAEIARAEERAKNWWSKNSARYGNEPHYLAIDTTKLLDGEIV